MREIKQEGEGEAAKEYPPYFLFLDGLRGVAAFAVLFWHYKHFFFEVPGECLIENSRHVQPFYAIFASFYEFGSYAVQLFWVLSGFVFFHVYGNAKNINGAKYAINRFARLYPLHFLTLVLVALLQGISLLLLGAYQIYPYNDYYHFVLHLFFVSQVGLEYGYSFNQPIWSVCVEVFSYVIFFAYCKYVRVNLISALIMFFVMGALYAVTGWMPLLCSMYFFSGGFVMLLHKWLFAYKGANLLCSIISLVFVYVSAVLVWIGSGTNEFLYDITHNVYYWYFLAFAYFPSLVWFVASLEDFVTPRLASVLKGVGSITYSSYLIHVPLQILVLIVIDYFQIGRGVFLEWYAWLLFFVSVLALSIPVYAYVEMPLQVVCKHWLGNLLVSSKPRPEQFSSSLEKQ